MNNLISLLSATLYVKNRSTNCSTRAIHASENASILIDVCINSTILHPSLANIKNAKQKKTKTAAFRQEQ